MMTNDELKKKTIEIISPYVVERWHEKIADKLIVAGIGDVKEAEHRAARAERAFSKLVHEMYEHGIRPMCDEKFFVESRLKDAEKELAEEKKDE